MSGLEEKGFGFGREAICRYGKKKGRRKLKNEEDIFSFNAVYLVC